MNKLLNSLSKAINVLMAVSLAVMAIVVFGNVLLRYIFNTGITWSEEVARFLFVWLTFLGAIGAFKDNEHLSVDLLVRKLPPGVRKIFFLISNALVLYVLWLVFEGSIKITQLNTNSYSPALGIPMSYVFVSGVVLAVCMAIIILNKLYQAFFRNVPIEELERTHGSEGIEKASSQDEIVSAPVLKVGDK